MIYKYTLTREYWTVYRANDEDSIVYGHKGGANQVSTNRDNFAEFDTEEELATYLGELTGVPTWYADQQPQEEEDHYGTV
jgi:hypothetical protein